MIAVTKKTLGILEEKNKEYKTAIRKYLQDAGLSNATISQLRNGKHLSTKSVEIIQGMVYDLKLKS